MKTKNVYAVNSGSYSDYRIDAIFTTRKKARDFMKAVPSGDYNDIAEFELDPPTVDLIKRGYSIWVVHMLRDGNTEKINRFENDTYNVSTIGHFLWKRSEAPAFKGKGVKDILVSKVWAKTENQAVKIANEQRIQMIASGEWKG